MFTNKITSAAGILFITVSALLISPPASADCGFIHCVFKRVGLGSLSH